MNIKGSVAQAFSLNVLIWLAMLTLFAGLLCCAAAAYLGLVHVLSPALAALITGLGLMIVFVMLALLVKSAVSPPKAESTANQPPQVDSALEQNLRPVIGNRATDWTRDNTGLAIVGALAAGAIITMNPSVRRFVVRAAGPIFTRKIIRSVQDWTDN